MAWDAFQQKAVHVQLTVAFVVELVLLTFTPRVCSPPKTENGDVHYDGGNDGKQVRHHHHGIIARYI